MHRIRIFLLLLFIPATAAQADVWSFATPSGNIKCVVGEDFGGSDLECTIYQRSAAMAQFPACPANRGLSVFMRNRGGVEVTCLARGQRASGAQHVAEYGDTGRFGGFTCLSTRKGLDCRNEEGRGFFLSRANQRAF